MNDPGHSEISSANRGIRVGLDTGGTFTDAVVLDSGRRVLASAKALTTHWDLSMGLGNALRALLEAAAGARPADISLVSVSTTLATNAVVENRFSPFASLLMGFDERMVELRARARGRWSDRTGARRP